MTIPTDAYIGKNVIEEHIKKAIEKILEPTEILLGAFLGQPVSDGGYGIQARYKGGMRAHDYMLLTDQKVIFWARGFIHDSTDSFRYEDIASVEDSKGLLLGEIVLNVRGAKERLRNMVKSDTPVAAKMIRDQINLERRGKKAEKLSQESIPDQIKKLAELRDANIITEEEFLSKKKDLLERM